VINNELIIYLRDAEGDVLSTLFFLFVSLLAGLGLLKKLVMNFLGKTIF